MFGKNYQHLFILDENGEPKPVADVVEWGKWFEVHKKERIVQQDTLDDGTRVSTVFLGLNHAWTDGPPLIFETMIFANKKDFNDLYCKRYSTRQEALIGHYFAMTIAAMLPKEETGASDS